MKGRRRSTGGSFVRGPTSRLTPSHGLRALTGRKSPRNFVETPAAGLDTVRVAVSMGVCRAKAQVISGGLKSASGVRRFGAMTSRRGEC